MHDYDGVVVFRSDGINQIIAVMPRGQIVPVSRVAVDGYVTFTRVGVDEYYRDLGLLGVYARGKGVPVVQPPVDARAVLACADLNGLEGLESEASYILSIKGGIV